MVLGAGELGQVLQGEIFVLEFKDRVELSFHGNFVLLSLVPSPLPSLGHSGLQQ